MRKFIMLLVALLFVRGVNAQQVYLDNVVIILDASGSMNNMMRGTNVRRMDSAKIAIKEVIKTIPQSTQVGLLVFGSKVNGWAYPLGPRDDGKLNKAIAGLFSQGGTPLGMYMKIGADRLLEERKAQYGYGSYRLLIVTDGEAGDSDLVNRYTSDVISRGIITDVIGVDMVSAHTLATMVHSYRRANDPESLKRAIQEVFAEVGKAGDDNSGESAFEELADLPDGMAMAIINTLVSSGNHPIGESVATSTHSSIPVAQAQRSVSAPSPVKTHRVKKRRGPGWLIFVVIGVIIFSVIKKGSRRR